MNYKQVVCKQCGKQFVYRPKDTNGRRPKFCCKECLRAFMDAITVTSHRKAAQNKIEQYKIIDSQNREKICNWLIDNFEKYNNLPLNRLTPLFDELSKLLGLKDARSVMRCFKITSKKLFYKELSKIYAELTGNCES